MYTSFKLAIFPLIISLCLSSFLHKSNANVINHELFEEHHAFELDDNDFKEPKIDYELGDGWSTRKNGKSSNFLQFIFTDHLKIKLNRFDFEYDQVKFSFEYFVFNQKEQREEIKAKINILGEESNPIVEFNKWTKIELNKVHKKSDNFIFELKFYIGDQSRLNDIKIKPINKTNVVFSNESPEDLDNHPIYIKNLKVILTHPSNNPLIIDIFKNMFDAVMDDKIITKENLIHFRFLPSFSDELTKYFYSKTDSTSLNLTVSGIDSDQLGDVCLQFSYQAAKDTTLKMKVLNKEKLSFFSVIDLDSTEMFVAEEENPNEEKKITDQNYELNSYYFKSIKWKKVAICLRNLCPSCLNLRKFYRLKFETVVDKTPNRFRYLAMTEVTVTTKNFFERVTKNYFTNWKTNGTNAMNEWFHFTGNKLDLTILLAMNLY